jgi:hypothetical protein
LLLRDRTKVSSFKDAFRQQGFRRIIASTDKRLLTHDAFASGRLDLWLGNKMTRDARFPDPDAACQLLQRDTTRGHTREFRPSTNAEQ